MDSLLLVLTVVGVVMVLIGVARMRGKRNREWDDVDHSVLFDKDDEHAMKAETVVANDDSLSEEKIAQELNQLSSQINAPDETLPPPQHSVVDRTKQQNRNEPAIIAKSLNESSTNNRADREPEKLSSASSKLSFFDKIIGDKQVDDDPAEGAYRKGAQEWVVVLNVMALDGEVFTGPGFFYALEDNGWSHGEMDIFHYSDHGVPLFSLVNMVKPGTFDLANIDKFRSPGISLFIQFPNDHGHGLRTFNMMLDMAQILADRLGGEVRDERRSVLTLSAIDHIREKIAAYDLKWQLPK